MTHSISIRTAENNLGFSWFSVRAAVSFLMAASISRSSSPSSSFPSSVRP
jgi:hypothetical protein